MINILFKEAKMSQLIKANNVSFIKEKNVILKNISLEILDNDFITIIGPNGAGKSMLLKCLMGFYKTTKGDVFIKKDLKIGYVPQKFAPSISMPINVKSFLFLRKKSNQTILNELTREINITHILNKQLSKLSGGELQRVLLVRALIDEPEILVLDEPVLNLDISAQLAFYKLLEHIYKTRKISILMVSHDLHMVMSISKKVICLFHHICCSGTPAKVAKDPNFSALFGDDMAKMMAVYQHSHNHSHVHKNDVDNCKCDGDCDND